VELADLLEIGFLENRNRLSRGEITSIAFAKETQQAFLTDDQRARKLASQIMDPSLVQTTPQLFGWLYFTNLLFDSDKAAIISEHQAFRRPLAPHFEAMYAKALEYRLREQGT
jgi:hypothetical protein